MQELIDKIKNVKDLTIKEYENYVLEYAKDKVSKDLKEAGLSIDDISKEEYESMLTEEIQKTKSFSKGVMTAGGLLVFLELLG